MFGLNEIIAVNNRAASALPVEDNFNRRPSAVFDAGEIVLHSARQRNTVRLVGPPASRFFAKWRRNGPAARARLIESFF
jgi:hypothetical protein